MLETNAAIAIAALNPISAVLSELIKSVQDQINEGKSKDEIYDFLISKYGEWIVYKPSFNKTNFLLWLLPYVILIFGLLIIFLILKKRKNSNIN